MKKNLQTECQGMAPHIVLVLFALLSLFIATANAATSCVDGESFSQGNHCIGCDLCNTFETCQSTCSTCVAGRCTDETTTCISTPSKTGYTSSKCEVCTTHDPATYATLLNGNDVLLRCPGEGMQRTGALTCKDNPNTALACPVAVPCDANTPSPRWSSLCLGNEVIQPTFYPSIRTQRDCSIGDQTSAFEFKAMRFELDCANFMDCFSNKMGSAFRHHQSKGKTLQPPAVRVPILVTLHAQSVVKLCDITGGNVFLNTTFESVRQYSMEVPFFLPKGHMDCLLQKTTVGCDHTTFVDHLKVGGHYKKLMLGVLNWFKDSTVHDCMMRFNDNPIRHSGLLEHACTMLREDAETATGEFLLKNVELELPPEFTAARTSRRRMPTLSVAADGCQGSIEKPCTNEVSTCCTIDESALTPHSFKLSTNDAARAPGKYSLLHHVDVAEMVRLGIHLTSLSGDSIKIIYPTSANIADLTTAMFSKSSAVNTSNIVSTSMTFDELAQESAVTTSIMAAQVGQESCDETSIVVSFDQAVAKCGHIANPVLTAEVRELGGSSTKEVQCTGVEVLETTPNHALSTHQQKVFSGLSNVSVSCVVAAATAGTTLSVERVRISSDITESLCTLAGGAQVKGSTWSVPLRFNTTTAASQTRLESICATTPSPPNSNVGGGSDDTACGTGCIAGVVVAAVAFTGIIIAGLLLRRHFQNEGGENASGGGGKSAIKALPAGSGGEVSVRPIDSSKRGDPTAKKDWKREVWQHTYEIIEKARQYTNRRGEPVDMTFHREDTLNVRHYKHPELQQQITALITREQQERARAMQQNNKALHSQFFSEDPEGDMAGDAEADREAVSPIAHPPAATAAPPQNKTKVEVINGDCIDVAVQMMRRDGLNPIIMDAASRMHFGGGYKNGASAQEEELCRRSNLGFMLDTALEYQQTSFFPLPAKDAIYIPKVKFFRLGPDHHYRTLDDPIQCAVGAIAAHNKPPIENGRMRKEEADDTRHMIETFLWMAKANKHDAVVLIALGCGAFQNPAEHVADLFATVLLDPRYRMVADGWFKRVVFAVLDDHNAKHQFNPEGNFVPFARMVGARLNGTVEANDSGHAVDPKEVKHLKPTFEFWQKPTQIDKKALPVRNLCRYGAKCRDHSKTHREKFEHPGDGTGGGNAGPAGSPPTPCKFGAACTRKNVAHWAEESHPPLCSNHTAMYPCALNDAHHRKVYSHPPPEAVTQIREILEGVQVSPTSHVSPQDQALSSSPNQQHSSPPGQLQHQYAAVQQQQQQQHPHQPYPHAHPH